MCTTNMVDLQFKVCFEPYHINMARQERTESTESLDQEAEEQIAIVKASNLEGIPSTSRGPLSYLTDRAPSPITRTKVKSQTRNTIVKSSYTQEYDKLILEESSARDQRTSAANRQNEVKAKRRPRTSPRHSISTRQTTSKNLLARPPSKHPESVPIQTQPSHTLSSLSNVPEDMESDEEDVTSVIDEPVAESEKEFQTLVIKKLTFLEDKVTEILCYQKSQDAMIWAMNTRLQTLEESRKYVKANPTLYPDLSEDPSKSNSGRQSGRSQRIIRFG